MYLASSKLAFAAVGNLALVGALLSYRLTITLFLGSLREVELERINERLSSALMETCLALTIFRQELNFAFLAMFTVLTFVKVFHWLVQDRLDYMAVAQQVTRLQHARIAAFMVLLLVSEWVGSAPCCRGAARRLSAHVPALRKQTPNPPPFPFSIFRLV